MNVLGTMEGAGRSPWRLNTALAVAMLGGALALGAIAYGLHELAMPLGAARPLVAAAFVAVLLVLEFTGRIEYIAGNRRVPDTWIAGGDWKAGVIWGSALGTGLITEAPFGVLHASLIIAILSPAGWPAIAAPVIFGAGRLVVTLVPGIRRRIVELADSFVTIAGRTVSVGFMISRVCSRVALLAVAAIALTGIIA